MEEEAKAEGKKRKAKKKQSLKHQITLNFIGLLLLSILTIFIINVLFLESYYVSKKKEILLQARATLSTLDIDALVHNDGTTEEIASEIVQTGSRNNLSWVLVNPDNSKYICWPENEGQLRSKLFLATPVTWIRTEEMVKSWKNLMIMWCRRFMTVLRVWIMWNAGAALKTATIF